MANLKEIRTRISSVVKTRQVTSAMKMVSAAKLKKAQDKIIRFRPFANKLHDILSAAVESTYELEGNIFFTQRKINKVLFVVVTSDRGLCGTFNANVIKKLTENILHIYPNLTKENIHLVTIGKKGYKILHKKYPIFKNDSEILEDTSLAKVEVFIKDIVESYLEEKYDRVEVVYNQFKNAAYQEVTMHPYLPIVYENGSNRQRAEYLFEPTIDQILHTLIPYLLKTSLHRILLDSLASEHAARMTAMYKATDNASELLKELRLHYNKARQAAITKEILEIISGAEALAV